MMVHGRHEGRGDAHLLALAGVVLLCCAMAAPGLGDDQTTGPELSDAARVVRGVLLVDAEGNLVADAVVVIDGQRIVRVGGEPPAGVPVDDYQGAVLCPGLIDCLTTLGVRGGMAELQTAVQDRVSAGDAFNRFSSQISAALAAGVTTFALVPDDQNLIGGRIAICQTAGPDGKPRVLSDTGPLKLSLSPAALKVDREPTSRGGALGLLRETLSAARELSSEQPLVDFARGRTAGFLAAPSGADVLAAADLAREFNLRIIPIHTSDAMHVAEHVAGQIAGAIVGPLQLSSGPRVARAAALFEEQDIPIAIAGGLPDTPADSLRIGAAVAARAGLSPAAARRAITVRPAEFLGVADRVGVLRAGHRADVVVFSGDPLDPRSRVLAVYVAGWRVPQAELVGASGVRP